MQLYGSIWIELILLKTENWKHCNKIIFKCVNSVVGLIFNEKVVKKWNLWVHEQYIMHCLPQKSPHLQLLFIEQYMNSNRVLPKRMKKKKKKTKNKNAKCRRLKRGSKHTHCVHKLSITAEVPLKFCFIFLSMSCITKGSFEIRLFCWNWKFFVKGTVHKGKS